MSNATSALAALKSTDGKGHLVGFKAYAKAHAAVLPEVLKGATARREAAARELLDLRTRGYAERAERCALALMARHPGISAALAFSFVSHKALAQGFEKRARREAALRAVREVTEAAESLLFRAGAHPDAFAPDACEAEAA